MDTSVVILFIIVLCIHMKGFMVHSGTPLQCRNGRVATMCMNSSAIEEISDGVSSNNSVFLYVSEPVDGCVCHLKVEYFIDPPAELKFIKYNEMPTDVFSNETCGLTIELQSTKNNESFEPFTCDNGNRERTINIYDKEVIHLTSQVKNSTLSFFSCIEIIRDNLNSTPSTLTLECFEPSTNNASTMTEPTTVDTTTMTEPTTVDATTMTEPTTVDATTLTAQTKYNKSTMTGPIPADISTTTVTMPNINGNSSRNENSTSVTKIPMSSRSTDSITMDTQTLNPDTTDNKFLYLLLGSCAVGLCALILIIVCLVFRCRRKPTRKENTKQSTTDNENDDSDSYELKDNILYGASVGWVYDGNDRLNERKSNFKSQPGLEEDYCYIDGEELSNLQKHEPI